MDRFVGRGPCASLYSLVELTLILCNGTQRVPLIF